MWRSDDRDQRRWLSRFSQTRRDGLASAATKPGRTGGGDSRRAERRAKGKANGRGRASIGRRAVLREENRHRSGGYLPANSGAARPLEAPSLGHGRLTRAASRTAADSHRLTETVSNVSSLHQTAAGYGPRCSGAGGSRTDP